MNPLDRRQFLRNGTLGFVALAATGRWQVDLFADPLGLPVGLELYTVRNDLEKDLLGTVNKVAEIGYKEVEVYDFYGRTASEFGRILKDNGLAAPSGHYTTAKIKSGWEKHIADAKEVGIRYMVNAILEPAERKSLDDYKKLAELFNKAGEETRKVGIQFCYHNHNFEFKKFDGTLPFDLLLEGTHPKLVLFEMDCFWVTHAGHDPVKYFRKHPGRFPLLHIKDLKAGNPPTTEMDARLGVFAEVGRGTIDWKRIFAAAPQGGIKHYYVEQDFCERSPLESIRISYDYLKSLKV